MFEGTTNKWERGMLYERFNGTGKTTDSSGRTMLGLNCFIETTMFSNL